MRGLGLQGLGSRVSGLRVRGFTLRCYQDLPSTLTQGLCRSHWVVFLQYRGHLEALGRVECLGFGEGVL